MQKDSMAQSERKQTEAATNTNVVNVNAQRLYITEMLKQHEEFLVIGLTGRVGSGCSKAADILGSSFSEIGLPPIYPGDMGLADDRERDRRILYRYAKHHWLKFDVIRVRTIITSFLLEEMPAFCEEIASYLYPNCNDGSNKTKEKLLKEVYNYLQNSCPDDSAIVSQLEKIQSMCKLCENSEKIDFSSLSNKFANELEAYVKAWHEKHRANNEQNGTINDSKEDLLANRFHEIYTMAGNSSNYANRIKLLEEVDTLLDFLSAKAAMMWWSEDGTVTDKLTMIGEIGTSLSKWTKVDELDFLKYVFFHNIVPAISDAIHDCLSKNKGSLFTELYQKYGNCIRMYGQVKIGSSTVPTKGEIGSNAFSIPRRINMFIKSFRHPFSRSFAKPTRIVIDSIKSVLEANYLRERYSAFYLFAISTEESVRVQRLMSSKNLNLREIHCIDWNEYSNYGTKIYQKFVKILDDRTKVLNEAKAQETKAEEVRKKLYQDSISERIFNADEISFIKRIEGDEGVLDDVRKDAYKNKLYQFILQDVSASIQNADVFISNNHSGSTKNMDLRWELVRNISLISHPGLLLPTPIERCMQAAFTAKANSGCLSRQVGAVVTDSEYNILSIGWNDVPCGDTSCSRKNLADIYNEQDLSAYTKYEITNEEFRDRVKNIYKGKIDISSGKIGNLLCGLPWRYCFKDIHIDGKHPMRSRAMHAEEKALANVQEKAINGCLFTTSSPCEMCSKNAKNHRIKKIYYIEPYPGISEDQYSNSGDINNRAEHILFTGAIGRAYTQMYTPIMPHKDILEFLGL